MSRTNDGGNADLRVVAHTSANRMPTSATADDTDQGTTPQRTVGPVLDIGSRNPGVSEAQHNSAVPRPHVT